MEAVSRRHDDRLTITGARHQKRQALFIDLLDLFHNTLATDSVEAQLERNIYLLIAHGDLETEQTIIRKGLAQILSGETMLPMAIKEFPPLPTTKHLRCKPLYKS